MEGRELGLPRGCCKAWAVEIPLLVVKVHTGDDGEASASAPAAGEEEEILGQLEEE